MSFGKGLLRRLLVNSIRGPNEGLSSLGSRLEILARYIVFVSRDARRDSRLEAPATLAHPAWQPNPEGKIIYDVGANNGDDTEYYLLRGFNVVAIEANNDLAIALATRFRSEISSGRLVVQNVAVTDLLVDYVDFYIFDGNDKISSTLCPDNGLGNFHKASVRARRLPDLIREFGIPYYVKIDIEGGDASVLSDLFSSGIRPQYVSAESHSIDVFSHFVSAGYKKFKIVEGRFIDKPYYSTAINRLAGRPFPEGSCGPFGEDVPGSWVNADEMFQYLTEHGLGWKDIHVSL